MINLTHSALGASGIMAGISSQARSGFQSNVMTKLDSIESKLSGSGGGGGAMPVEQPPMMPVGNLAGSVPSQDPVLPDPAIPEMQYAGGGGRAPIDGNFNTPTQQTADDIYGSEMEKTMSLQTRSLI
jgi:hypothetical protein